MTLIRRTMSRAPKAKAKDKAKTPAEPADDNDDDPSDDEPAPKAKAKAKALLLPGRQLWATLRTSAASRNFPKQYLHYHKRRAAGQSPLSQTEQDPHVQHHDMWCILGRGTTNGCLAVGTIINLKLGMQPKPVSEAGFAPWQGGDFTKM